jgi:hypothetical protein
MPGIQGSIPGPQGAENLPASGALRPQQFLAGTCVLFEGCLISEMRRALGGDHTRSRTASYSVGSDESGDFGIAIVVRHDCLLIAAHFEHGAVFGAVRSFKTGSGVPAESYELIYIENK